MRQHLPAFLAAYFPAMYAVVDWSAAPQWLDKEVSQVLGRPRRRNRAVDVLVKLGLRSGGAQWVFVHLEIQTGYDKRLVHRIAHYNSGLF